MAKKPGNPKNGRRLQGVPKAGPLYVNGQEVPKGNVQKAVSQMYRSASRSLAEAEGQLAPVMLGQARQVPGLEGTRCSTCDGAWSPMEEVAWEPSTGRFWHMDPHPAWSTKGGCRYQWVQQHTVQT